MSFIRNFAGLRGLPDIFTNLTVSKTAYQFPTILVSQPHKLSNIRYIDFKNADKVERTWLEQRQSQLQQHHLFWKENNIKFFKQKQEFIDNNGGSVTSFQLSEFYKRYLEESHEMMVEYNRNLWIENVKSLGPGLKYEAHQLKKIVHKATRNIRERFRLFLAFWFTAGLTAPLLLIK